MQARKIPILAEPRPHGRRPWVLGAIVGTSLLGVVAATAMVPGEASSPIPQESVIERLAPLGMEAVTDPALPFVFDERVQPGDTIHSIFRRLGVSDTEALEFLTGDAEARAALTQLRAGRSLFAVVESGGKLHSLSLPIARGGTRFKIERTEGGFQSARESVAAVDTVVEMRSGTIKSSLFAATDAAGVPDSVATKLAEIFGTQMDFTSDLREDDQFSVVYETVFDQGIPLRAGRILAAEFVNRGKRHIVVLHRDAEGTEAYYTPDGRGLNQAFLRYPLEFTRISSNFGRRLHPIHRSWRSHNGVDFAAPRGTPVKAASDGTVTLVGQQRGYGNIVVIQHRDRHSTAYAHLNGFARGLRKGDRVRQGDLVGYVGSTGWATGPHLHYEIRVDNVAQDPMKIALPTVRPLDKRTLVAFRQQTTPMLDRLALLNYSTVALAD